MLRRSFFENTSSSLLAEEVGLCSALPLLPVIPHYVFGGSLLTLGAA